MDKTQIHLSEPEKNSITRIRVEMEQARSNLANAAFQTRQAELARDAAADAVAQIGKRLEERIGDIAKDHGVDLTSTEVGKWSFDLDKLELRRVDVPVPALAPVSIPAPAPPTKSSKKNRY